MENDQTIKEIYRAVGKLEGIVMTGFDSVNSRLDKINGGVADNVIDINKLQQDSNNLKGKATMLGIIGGIVGAVAGFFVSFFKH